MGSACYGSSHKLEEQNKELINYIKETMCYLHLMDMLFLNISDLDYKIVFVLFMFSPETFSTNSQTHVKNQI